VGVYRRSREATLSLEFRRHGQRIDLITLTDDPRAVGTFLMIQRERGALQNELISQNLVRLGAGKVIIRNCLLPVLSWR